MANARPSWGSQNNVHPEDYIWHSIQNKAWNSCIQMPGLLDRKGAGGSSARNVGANARHNVPSTKRIRQQLAHRSRMKKLQYIADLERSVQILLAKATAVSAELEHYNQWNLVLGMETTALKQQLDSLSQEQVLKHFEQSMLEKELGRLQFQFQQQQQQQQQRSMHPSYPRSSGDDLVSNFANLSV